MQRSGGGRDLVLCGSAADIETFKSLVKQSFAGKIEVQVAENGLVTLHKLGSEVAIDADKDKDFISTLGTEDKAFFHSLNEVISDHNGTVALDLVNSSTLVDVDDFDREEIDVADLAKLPIGDNQPNVQGSITHVVVEQYAKQVKSGTDEKYKLIDFAHPEAQEASNAAAGLEYEDDEANIIDKRGFASPCAGCPPTVVKEVREQSFKTTSGEKGRAIYNFESGNLKSVEIKPPAEALDDDTNDK